MVEAAGQRTWRRRTALRWGLWGASAAVAGGLWPGTGYARLATSQAVPRLADPKVHLWYSAGGYESTRSQASLGAIQELLSTHFLSKHPGIELKVSFTFHGNTVGLMSAILAGQGPDVFEEWYDLPLLIQ